MIHLSEILHSWSNIFVQKKQIFVRPPVQYFRLHSFIECACLLKVSIHGTL